MNKRKRTNGTTGSKRTRTSAQRTNDEAQSSRNVRAVRLDSHLKWKMQKSAQVLAGVRRLENQQQAIRRDMERHANDPRFVAALSVMYRQINTNKMRLLRNLPE